MAEKPVAKLTNSRLHSISNQFPSSIISERGDESDRAFLERTNTNALLSSLLNSIINDQPDDPIDYLCKL
jgi:hypothetical protein